MRAGCLLWWFVSETKPSSDTVQHVQDAVFSSDHLEAASCREKTERTPHLCCFFTHFTGQTEEYFSYYKGDYYLNKPYFGKLRLFFKKFGVTSWKRILSFLISRNLRQLDFQSCRSVKMFHQIQEINLVNTIRCSEECTDLYIDETRQPLFLTP